MINNNKILLPLLSISLLGCDVMPSTQDQQLESRTMIIGGVPVHDKDYLLPDQDQAFNEVQVSKMP